MKTTFKDYLETERTGYQYAVHVHEQRQANNFPNKLDYLMGRLDAINAMLEILTTMEQRSK